MACPPSRFNLCIVLGFVALIWCSSFPFPHVLREHTTARALFYSNLAFILLGFQSDYHFPFIWKSYNITVNASNGSATSELEEIDTSTPDWREQFYNKWTLRSPRTRKPIILRNIVHNSKHFAQMRQWNINYIKNIFGNTSVVISINATKDKALVRMLSPVFFQKYQTENLYMRCQPAPSRDTENMIPYNFFGTISGKVWEIEVTRRASNDPLACFFIGNDRTLSPLHCDVTTNFFIQVQGRKRWYFYPPSETMLLFPLPFRWSIAYKPRLFFDERNVPRQTARPPHKGIREFSSVSKPGDLLIIPSMWYHSVENLDNVTVGLSVAALDFFGSFARNTVMTLGTFLNPKLLFHVIRARLFTEGAVQETFLSQYFINEDDVL